MFGIGGNTKAEIQIKTTVKNYIHESEPKWDTVQTLTGWLDLMTGNASYTTYKTKLDELSHVFICDYTPLDARICPENSRLLIDGKTYAVKYIDNPMGLQDGSQWEIYLDYIGGQTHGGEDQG